MNAHFPQPLRKLKVAIIGSGISGASAAWALNSLHDVTLYEKAERTGGHTATVDVDYDGVQIPVDTGFIVYNEPNYPNLTALFRELGVATHASDMSFSLSLDHGKLEWAGGGLSSVFAQTRNLLSPSFLLMIREILRFNRTCLRDRDAGHLATRSIGDYLDWRGFSPGFTNNYLVPMAAAIWSTPATKMLQFPAEHFVNFFDNHRLIYSRQHQWRTVTGGSRNYLDKLLRPLGDRVKTGRGVRSVIRDETGVIVIDDAGTESRFDKVIFATHSDQTLRMLAQPTGQEAKILAAVPYQPNRVVLHRDERLMPNRRKVWASWNYLRSSHANGNAAVAVTYWMNRLQGIDNRFPLFVTLNPDREPDASKVFAEFSYEHPQFSAESVAAQNALRAIQGQSNSYFVGAWIGYGFHEDGLVSGLAAAEALGANLPWRQHRSIRQDADKAA
ncbi:FAD-dependent oxidoreductase [Rhizobium grahamii]|uniref:FAD-dependent oxidoreductase n=1 Tax=Rhizobium grahamii TaxID=1120045 RepID=A0A5Q0C3A7_9HYPH|nr:MULTISPECIES: FAD-dependent oxidoreductase [Rhizobium]QFY59923.1 FAD-dependent oxidoreductase [Rhizobium grahamii]QRM50959.1 FAD-dependent oxidoreductase [Rhizobium sp. BG6]